MLLLATLGQIRADPASFPGQLLKQLYLSAQLFGLEGDWTFDVDPLPWELEIARILAPLVALTSIILVLARGAWITLSNQRARFYRDHIVLVGVDELGWHFARSCARDGLPLVAIDGDESNPYVDRVRRLNIPVIVGDPLSTITLRRSGVRSAANLVAFLDDATNVELTVCVKTLLERRERAPSANPLRIHCHMVDPQLALGLESYAKLFKGRDLVETSFFNVDELAARDLTRHQPSDVYADAMARDHVHIVVIGWTRMAREVVLQAANTAHFASSQRPRVTICATNAAARIAQLRDDYPGLSHALTVDCVEAPASLQGFGALVANGAIAGVSQYIVCGCDDAESLAQALVLRREALLQHDVNAPILLHMRTSDGLARMLEAIEPEPEIPDGLCAFGTHDEVLNEATIINARQDGLARALHESFVEQAMAKADFDPDAPSNAPWRMLAENYRRDSRYEADHFAARLRAVGCIEVDDDTTLQFGPQEIERLALIEKRRFIAARYVAGWRHGTVKSAFGKVTDLRPWDELSDRSYDLANAAAMPELLHRCVGKGVRRVCVIGVTGHRRDRIIAHRGALIRALEAVVDAIVAAHPDAAFTVLSPLAEGADRLVARIVLERIPGAQLHVPLPLPYETYTRDFGSHSSLSRGESIKEFQELLGRANRYFEMPLRFGTAAELERSSDEGRQRRAEQYALTGAFIVQRSHEFIAVWNGTDSGLVGGTSQVVAWRQSTVPEPYRFPDAFFPAVAATPPFIVPPDAPAGFIPQRAEAMRN